MSYYESSATILARMQSQITNVNTAEGSFVYDALSPVSIELENIKLQLDEVLKKVFALSAYENQYSDFLDLHASQFGLTRKAGAAATGLITFYGQSGTSIDAGTTVQTQTGLKYTTTEDATIAVGAQSVDINVEAEAIGSAYNKIANTITVLPVPISGISSITNLTAFTTGYDTEDDKSLYTRLCIKVRTPATSGNVYHYLNWALEVEGIGEAKVFPLWNGNGTVKVCAVNSNMQPLSDELLVKLQNYVESQRPIGATVTYESATALPINISVNITKTAAYLKSQIDDSITETVTNYLKSIATTQSYVSYSKIGSLIMAIDGVVDYDSLVINGGTIKIPIGDEDVPTIGTVITNVA